MVEAVQEGIVQDMNGLETNGHGQAAAAKQLPQREDGEESKWYEEEIDDDLKLCYALNR
jgi:thermospermine synthase